MTSLLIVVMVGVPLVHSSLYLHSYSVPKFAIMLVACAMLTGALAYFYSAGQDIVGMRRAFGLLVLSCVVALAVSTARGVNPIISAQGSFHALMGLSTYICFAVLAIGSCTAAGLDLPTFKRILKAVTVAGFLASLIGVAQFAGVIEIDPGAAAAFGDPARIYTTLGHPDFAGNFLLYVVFTSEATALLFQSSKWQAIAGITCVLSLIALVFTGTRGAWVGLFAGIAVAIIMAFTCGLIAIPSPRVAGRAGLAALLLVALFSLWIKDTTLWSPVRSRIISTVQEGFTGSGRTADWKLALRMFRKYWLTGCGPDAFRLAQLPFKTDEYARATSGVDAEDPHNIYLSSLISTGLLGFLTYLALIYYSLYCYWRGIKVAGNRHEKAAGLVLLSGMVGALAHGVFLHHIVSTGAYFFVFLGLGPAWAALQEGAAGIPRSSWPQHSQQGSETVGTDDEPISLKLNRSMAPPFMMKWQRVFRAGIIAVTATLVTAAGAYSYMLLRADYYIVKCLSAAAAGDAPSTVESGLLATAAPLYQTDFNFYYGGALEKVSSGHASPGRERLLMLALEQSVQAVNRTLSPVPNRVMLALLKIETGDFDGATQIIRQAEQTDPHSYLPCLAWSTLHLRQGTLDLAVEEYSNARSLGAPYVNIRDLDTKLSAAVREAGSSDLWYQLTGKVHVLKNKRTKELKAHSLEQ